VNRRKIGQVGLLFNKGRSREERGGTHQTPTQNVADRTPVPQQQRLEKGPWKNHRRNAKSDKRARETT